MTSRSKNAVRSYEAEIEKSREESNWKKVVDLAQQLKARSPQHESLAHFLIGEGKLESFLDECPPIKENIERAQRELSDARGYLTLATDEAGKKAGVALDSHLLLGKLNYACGAYDDALKNYKLAELNTLTEKELPVRSLRIVAESYAIKGLCLEQTALPGSTSRYKQAEREAEMIRSFEVSSELTLLYLQRGGACGAGVALETALQRAPLLHIRAGRLAVAIERYREMLTAVESVSTQALRLTLARQLAEVLMRGVTGQVYKAPTRRADGATEGPWKPKKYTAINQVSHGPLAAVKSSAGSDRLFAVRAAHGAGGGGAGAAGGRGHGGARRRAVAERGVRGAAGALSTHCGRARRPAGVGHRALGTAGRGAGVPGARHEVLVRLRAHLAAACAGHRRRRAAAARRRRHAAGLPPLERVGPRAVGGAARRPAVARRLRAAAGGGRHRLPRALGGGGPGAVAGGAGGGGTPVRAAAGALLPVVRPRTPDEGAENELPDRQGGGERGRPEDAAEVRRARRRRPPGVLPPGAPVHAPRNAERGYGRHARLPVRARGVLRRAAAAGRAVVVGVRGRARAAGAGGGAPRQDAPPRCRLDAARPRSAAAAVGERGGKELLKLLNGADEAEARGADGCSEADAPSDERPDSPHSARDAASLRASSSGAYRVPRALCPAGAGPGAGPGAGSRAGQRARAWLLLADLCLRLDRVSAAAGCVSEAAALTPFSHLVLYTRGLVHAAGSNWEEARQCFTDALAIHPTHLDSIVQLGATYYSLGWLRLAEKTLREAGSLEPLRADTWRRLSLVLCALREPGAAADAAAAALALHPLHDAHALHALHADRLPL